MKKRFFEARPKNLPKGYDSWLEYELHQTALKGTQHHVAKDDRIDYSVEHMYEPDFTFKILEKMYVIEVKGRFRDSAEMSKYIWINKYLNKWKLFDCEEIELVFIFDNAASPTPFAKARKDGTKRSHGEWAISNGFRYLCKKRDNLTSLLTLEELVGILDTVNN